MSPLEPGLEILPGLTLLRLLGRGGMGEAWLARDAERGEDVVAKVVPADASPDKVALLRREARLVRKLAHPRIVPVYAFRGGERGSAVTLRYMPGGDAGSQRGAPPLEVVRLGRDVAEALEYLHGLGVVHRDVKPSNVLLDGEGRACLADFGIAAVAWGDEEGIVLRGGGSRSSLSPQQIAGEPAQPADDLYALGSLLFELLSGRPPFPREASDEEIRTLPPPPVASPFPVPDALRALVASLLAKSPNDRPPSAAAAREALQAIEEQLGGLLPAHAGPPVRLQPPPRVSSAPVVPAELRDRVSRLESRPPRAGLSAGQVTLLAALGVAVVVAVAWLPRWAQAPIAPAPTAETPKAAPAPADPPAVPEATATTSAGGPAAGADARTARRASPGSPAARGRERAPGPGARRGGRGAGPGSHPDRLAEAAASARPPRRGAGARGEGRVGRRPRRVRGGPRGGPARHVRPRGKGRRRPAAPRSRTGSTSTRGTPRASRRRASPARPRRCWSGRGASRRRGRGCAPRWRRSRRPWPTRARPSPWSSSRTGSPRWR